MLVESVNWFPDAPIKPSFSNNTQMKVVFVKEMQPMDTSLYVVIHVFLLYDKNKLSRFLWNSWEQTLPLTANGCHEFTIFVLPFTLYGPKTLYLKVTSVKHCS